MSIKIKVTYIQGENNKELHEIALDWGEVSSDEIMAEITGGYIEAYKNQQDHIIRKNNKKFSTPKHLQ